MDKRRYGALQLRRHFASIGAGTCYADFPENICPGSTHLRPDLLLALASQSASAVEQPLLSLDSALARAFANNPELAAARWEIDIAQGARQQAGLIPNPVLSVDAEDTRRDSRTTSVKLSQALELGGKRGARIDVASRGQELAALELERRRNQLRADVLDAYYTALRAQERTQLAGRSLALAERGVAVARAGSTPARPRRWKPPGPRCNWPRCAWN